MTGWLDPLRQVLDRADRPVTVFFRDDDAGWGDDALRAVMDRCAAAGVPLDVAVIPAELSPRLADELVARRAAAAGRVGLHQHGWCHANHEPEGRRWEFGPARSAEEQRDDLARGAARMQEAFGLDERPVFVPPWNRCTDTTAAVLVELGFAVLSRDVTAKPLPGSPLPELPVTVDWSARRKGVPIDRRRRGELLAGAAAADLPVGVMLHHAVLTRADLDDLAELLQLVGGHSSVRLRSMADLGRDLVAVR